MMLAAVAAASAAMAQGNGSAGITEATQMVTSYFDPGTKIGVCGGSCDRTRGRDQGLPEVQFGRSRHLENGKQLVRSLYLPDSRRYHSEVVLPLKNEKQQ